MNKEQAARNFLVGDSEDINKYSPGYCFVSGWDAGQKQLLGEAASGFEEWLRAQYPNSYLGHGIHEDRSKDAWQAAKLSCAAELAAKDAELERVKRERDEAVEVLKMVEDNTKMPHQHSDYYERLCCLSERAREFLAKLTSGEGA